MTPGAHRALTLDGLHDLIEARRAGACLRDTVLVVRHGQPPRFLALMRETLDGAVAGNVLKHSTGGLNIDACRVRGAPAHDCYQPKGGDGQTYGFRNGGERSTKAYQAHAAGRWPTNVLVVHTPGCTRTVREDTDHEIWSCTPTCPTRHMPEAARTIYPGFTDERTLWVWLDKLMRLPVDHRGFAACSGQDGDPMNQTPLTTPQYERLSDAAAATGDPRYTGEAAVVWYSRPDRFQDFSMGAEFLREQGTVLPTIETLETTHVRVGALGETSPEQIFVMMQGEVWSPLGQARTFIRSIGLKHTSMSVGDIVQIGSALHMVEVIGFERIT